MRVSVSGRNVFSFTGCFSSSSSVSRPSMTLCGTEESKVWAATTTQEMSISVLQSSTERWHTFQTLCTSYPDEVVWHMWWKTGNRLCLGHCLPLKQLLWHYAEMKGGVLWQWYGNFNNDDNYDNNKSSSSTYWKRYSLWDARCTHLQIYGPICLFLLYLCLKSLYENYSFFFKHYNGK